MATYVPRSVFVDEDGYNDWWQGLRARGIDTLRLFAQVMSELEESVMLPAWCDALNRLLQSLGPGEAEPYDFRSRKRVLQTWRPRYEFKWR